MSAPFIHAFLDQTVTQEYIDKLEKATPSTMDDVRYSFAGCKNIDLLRLKRPTQIKDSRFKEVYLEGPLKEDQIFFNIQDAPEFDIINSNIFHVHSGISTLVAVGKKSEIKHLELSSYGHIEDSHIEKLTTYYFSIVRVNENCKIDVLDATGGGTIIVQNFDSLNKILLGGGSSIQIITTPDKIKDITEEKLKPMISACRNIIAEPMVEGPIATLMLHG